MEEELNDLLVQARENISEDKAMELIEQAKQEEEE